MFPHEKGGSHLFPNFPIILSLAFPISTDERAVYPQVKGHGDHGIPKEMRPSKHRTSPHAREHPATTRRIGIFCKNLIRKHGISKKIGTFAQSKNAVATYSRTANT
jgi:hypothetical protein